MREQLLALQAHAVRTEPHEMTREQRHRRRRTIRHDCKVQIALRVAFSENDPREGHDTWTVSEHAVKGRLLDLSHDGCSVFVKQPLEIGQALSLKIALKSGVTVPAQGVVRWTRAIHEHSGYGSGIQFASLSAEGRKEILKYLDYLERTIGL